MIWKTVLMSKTFRRFIVGLAVVAGVFFVIQGYNKAIKDSIAFKSESVSLRALITEKDRLYNEMSVEFNALSEKHRNSTKAYNQALKQIEEMNDEKSLEWRDTEHPDDVNCILQYNETCNQ